jgi:PAS domain S-box-containing protein
MENVIKLITSPEQKDTASTVDYRLKHRELGYRWMSDNRSVVYDETDVPVAVVGNLRDITEQKMAEEASQESEERFRNVLDNSIDMVYRLDLHSGRYDYLSPSSKKLLGYSPEEFIALGPEHAASLIHPDDIERYWQTVIKAMGRTKQKEATATFEYRINHRELGYRWMADSLSVIHDDANVPEAIVGSLRDITEQKIVEEALQQREQDYSVLVESIYDGIAVVDAETLKIVFGNRRASKIFGFDPILKDGVGINLLEFVHPEDKDIAIKGFTDDLYQAERRKSYEVRAKTNDGRDIWVSALATRIEFQGRLAVLLSVADITERKRMEEDLRIKEDAIENSLSAVAMYDVEGKITYANQAFMKLWGWDKKEELLGKSYWMFFKSDEVVKDIAGAMIKRQSWEGELVARRRDGKDVLVHVFSAIVNDNLGNPVQTISSFTDITERKIAEKALRESEEKFRRLVEEMNDGYCVLQGSRVVFANARSAEMFGYTPEEVIGKTVQELLPPEIVDELVKMRLMRQSGGTVPEQYETTLIRKDGMPLIVELGTRVIEYAGKPALSVVIRDVTKRKQAEEALRHSEEYFRALTENVLDVIVVLNRDASVRYKSPSFEQMVGKDRAGKKPFEFVHPDDIPNATEIFTQLTQNPGATVHTEIRGQHRDGSWHTFEVIGKNLLDDPAVAGIVANFRDVTERKQAEQEVHRLNEELEQRVIERTTQLEAVNKELEAFAYSVSHDLRAPLRSIDGFSQILMEDYTDKLDDEGKDYLHRVRSASQRMGELIDDILSLSRVTRGEMRYEAVDLSALAETISTELQQSQTERQAEFIITPEMVTKGDSHLLRAALDNLLGNAWKFTKMRTPARLEFGTIENNDQLVYFIRDNGVGFDMAYADKLFGAFQRLHSPSEFEGTGIGLATVQRIIHRHGGRIWAESVVDQGTTFYFTLNDERGAK